MRVSRTPTVPMGRGRGREQLSLATHASRCRIGYCCGRLLSRLTDRPVREARPPVSPPPTAGSLQLARRELARLESAALLRPRRSSSRCRQAWTQEGAFATGDVLPNLVPDGSVERTNRRALVQSLYRLRNGLHARR